MLNMNTLLLSDTYKQTHSRMYPNGLTKLVSYWVPRKSMFKNTDTMVFFGLQAFIKEYLLNYFQKNFFDMPLEDVMYEYTYYMNIQLGSDNYDEDNIMKLHKLGYLPLQIRAIPEGTFVTMGVPCIELTNTHPDFAWVVQWIECILQAELWRPCTHATVGNMYRRIAERFYDKTVENGNAAMAMSDFGMRGMSCIEDSTRTSAAWLLSFDKTSTIPALKYLDTMYNADCKDNHIGIGAVSTEHSDRKSTRLNSSH